MCKGNLYLSSPALGCAPLWDYTYTPEMTLTLLNSFRINFQNVTLTVTYTLSRTKNQPKEEVFGPDIPWTSGGHSRGYPAPKLRSGHSKSWKKKNKHLAADIHDTKVADVHDPKGFPKTSVRKTLGAEFSFPILLVFELRM